MSSIIEGMTKDLKTLPKRLKTKAEGADTKKLVLLNLPYVLAGYFCNKTAYLWRMAEGSNASDKMMAVMSGMDKMFSNPLPSFFMKDLLIGIVGGVLLKLVVYYKAKNAKNFRHGVEYGSARWGNAKDIEPYMDSVFENNILLTATERLMMSGRPKEPKYARNKNILVIGGSGSGKTRFFVKPNLMQMHSSYVVTDPKGTVLVECGKMLNCDTTLFLGGKEKTTLKELEDVLGKETIDLYNTSDTRGTSQSYGLNYQKTGKALMSQDEIAVMDGGKCIMQLRGVRPFFSDKFDITKHKRYKELSDYDKKNAFDMEQYVKHLHHMKLTEKTKVDEAFECGEISPDTTE